jgi:hypothetical protein
MKTILETLLVCSAVTLLCPPGIGGVKAEEPRNLLKQPAFEKRTWDVKFFGPAGTVSTDSVELHEGHPSLRIEIATPAGTAFLNQKIPCRPSTRYRFSGWIKATKMVLPKEQEGAQAGAALAVYPGLGNSGWLSATEKWVYAAVDFKTKPNQTEVLLGPRIGFQQTRPTGTAWFADLSLIELKEEHGPGR